jgi:hypothetical protein
MLPEGSKTDRPHSLADLPNVHVDQSITDDSPVVEAIRSAMQELSEEDHDFGVKCNDVAFLKVTVEPAFPGSPEGEVDPVSGNAGHLLVLRAPVAGLPPADEYSYWTHLILKLLRELKQTLEDHKEHPF